MLTKFSCEKGPDGAWWEADIPAEWSVKRDTSRKNWPYIFTSPNGSTLSVRWAKNVFISRAAWQPPLPQSLVSEDGKITYQFTMQEAQSDRVAEIEKRTIGSLVGFVYEKPRSEICSWCGFFMHSPFFFRVGFEAPMNCFELESKVAISILSTTRVFS